MPTLRDIQRKSDPIIGDVWTRLVTAQEAYHAKHGKYFQLLQEPRTRVVDGVDKTFRVRKPQDEHNDADVKFNAGRGKLPFQLEVHEHKKWAWFYAYH